MSCRHQNPVARQRCQAIPAAGYLIGSEQAPSARCRICQWAFVDYIEKRDSKSYSEPFIFTTIPNNLCLLLSHDISSPFKSLNLYWKTGMSISCSDFFKVESGRCAIMHFRKFSSHTALDGKRFSSLFFVSV